LLQADNVRFAYGVRPILDGVSLQIPPGTIVGILGPNGSGKTTLLRLLSGTRTPTSGSVRLDGTSLSDLSRRAVARRIEFRERPGSTCADEAERLCLASDVGARIIHGSLE